MKNLRIIISMFFILFLTSCGVTQDVVWGAKIDEDEIVKDLLINEDGSQVIVVAKKYYYFADDEKKIVKKISFWEGKEKLKASINFGAKGKQAEVEIYLEAFIKDFSKKQIEFLKSIGGRECDWAFDKNYVNKIYTRICLPTIDLKGKRISVKKGDIDLQGFVSTDLIKKEQEAAIFEDPTPLQTTGKILLTPFTLALDIITAPFLLLGYIAAGVGSN